MNCARVFNSITNKATLVLVTTGKVFFRRAVFNLKSSVFTQLEVWRRKITAVYFIMPSIKYFHVPLCHWRNSLKYTLVLFSLKAPVYHIYPASPLMMRVTLGAKTLPVLADKTWTPCLFRMSELCYLDREQTLWWSGLLKNGGGWPKHICLSHCENNPNKYN